MKRHLLAFTIGMTFLLSACGKSADDKSGEVLSAAPEEKIEVQILDDLKNADNDEKGLGEADLEAEIMDGDRFYDIGAKSVTSLGQSCFMQPILQNPTVDTVTVQWFTKECGDDNKVLVYDSWDGVIDEATSVREIEATSYKLSRIRGGKTDKDKDDPKIACDVYKHVAVVDNLPEYHGFIRERRCYKVVTDQNESDIYTLAASPVAGTGIRVLLTSDHQIKSMVAANIQKVYETVGNVDAIFVNGDLADVADRGYDWFYADNAFFRCFTATANDEINGQTYYGAPLLQQAPVYIAIGNHDVMGVYDDETPLVTQFNEPRTRQQAEKKWNELSDKSGINHDDYVENHSYNTITIEELFENPAAADGCKKYYGVSFGDIRLISLDVSRVWRLPNIGLGGKYSEIPGADERDYAEGDFIFESIKEESNQIKFLDEELSKEEYINAPIKVVMFHSEAHSLGGNQIPAFTDPVSKMTVSPITGQTMTIYDYPIQEDYIQNVIEPRLEKSNTTLLFEAHSHLWNRFKSAGGMNILETSNVGNSYGGYDDSKREQFPSAFNKDDQYHAISGEWNQDNYVLEKDPYGLEAIVPNISQLPGGKSYLDSNTITAFSILDTKKGTVDSYYFDTEKPDSEAVLFDSFEL